MEKITACQYSAMSNLGSMRLINMFTYKNKKRQVILTITRKPSMVLLFMKDAPNINSAYKKPFDSMWSEYGRR